MYLCVICRFPAELDDVIAPTSTGRCVCLRCYARETESTRHLSKSMLLDVCDALGAAGVS
jgi:hypothetical protein